MLSGKFNIIIDAQWGSSGKGKFSTWLADKFGVEHVSSSNAPNAGHSAVLGSEKFIAKAIPTALCLNKFRSKNLTGWLSPGSGFFPSRLKQEWEECGRPHLNIHGRASIVTDQHAAREREGAQSTKHIASTMQGSATAIVDKIMRLPDLKLARDVDFQGNADVMTSWDFRHAVHETIPTTTWLHEGSQGYALSIDHGSHYPFATSRNCGTQAQLDQMAVPPSWVGDVYMNLRPFPIRVGNVVEDGKQTGYSGDWYPDQEELTWEQVGRMAGMPDEILAQLPAMNLTTVTKRVRRCATMSYIGLHDAARTNGCTKLFLNFAQYIDYADEGKRGEGDNAYAMLTTKTRKFIERIEDTTGVPVVAVGTGADHDDVVTIF